MGTLKVLRKSNSHSCTCLRIYIKVSNKPKPRKSSLKVLINAVDLIIISNGHVDMILNKFIKAHWRCSLVPKLNYPSSSANKILAKVPRRRYSCTAIKIPVQRMGLFTSYFNLCQDRKIHIVLVFNESCNATVSQRLLISKLVTRKCHNTKVLIIKFWLEFHKLLVMLVCVATLTCNIHNQQDLTVWNNNNVNFQDDRQQFLGQYFFKSGGGGQPSCYLLEWKMLSGIPPPPPLRTSPASFGLGVGIVWGGPMRTLGVGNRPLSKKKKCKSWGLTRGKIESCIIDDEHNQPLFTGFFSYFTKI